MGKLFIIFNPNIYKKDFRDLFMKIYDLIIIGAGPAGLCAGIYAGRYKLETLIIGKIPGGTAGTIHEVCNFPSYEKITGMELTLKMIKQVQNLGVRIKQEIVEYINKNKNFEIKTNKDIYYAKKIILAAGSERKKLGIENEQKFTGKGVSYCATCDSCFYKNKIVGVVGGSDSALMSALLLTKFAKKIYIIYRKEKFTKPEPIWIEQINKEKKIEVLFNTKVKKILGEEKLSEIEIETKGKRSTLKIGGLFIEIGGVPNIKLAEKLKVNLEDGEIIADKSQKTNVQGVFAAGDCTNNSLKQVVTACSEGAVACYSVYNELKREKN